MHPGEKIKELRKAKRMTQERLAGDRITRNMLCEIERGKATPSLDTLNYIADALGVPTAFLLDGSESLAAYAKREALPTIHRLYLAGRYGECFRLCEELPGEPDNEIAFILAQCALEEGKRAFYCGNMETALVYCGESLNYAKMTIYPTESIRAAALLHAAISGNVASPRRDFDEAAYLPLAATAAGAELYAYMTDNPSFAYTDPRYAEHAEVRRLIHERRYREALPRLLALEERKSEEGISAYFLFRLYSDMELCYREERDFEKAYKYSTKRMTLLAAFQS